jgi:peroxiredoxin
MFAERTTTIKPPSGPTTSSGRLAESKNTVFVVFVSISFDQPSDHLAMDHNHLNRRRRPLRNRRTRSAWIALVLIAAYGISGSAANATDNGQPGSKVATFELPAVDVHPDNTPSERRLVAIGAAPDATFTVVCFLGVECPLARLYGPRLNAMADEFADRGVRFIGINSNRQDSLEDVRSYVSDHQIAFPIGKDYQNIVADQFGARRTPEVFVIDATLTIRYRGRIDDQYEPGLSRSKPSRRDLRVALDELLAGKPVSQPANESTGCLIGRVKSVASQPQTGSNVTFAKQVSRVLIKHCVECHRAGEIGPFALTDYDEVIGWADTMLESIEDNRMPPWHASNEHGVFSNARIMPTEDKQLLREWVTAGVPFGDPGDLPDLPAAVAGWQLPREPDLVLNMRARPFTVPATGTVDYQYFVVDPGFKEDKWISAAQVVPGSPSVVHHAICFVRPPDGARFRGVGWLTAYVPSQRSVTLPPGAARLVPAGSKLVFQMHYTPNGTEQQDMTKIGILFGRDKEVTHEVFTVVAIDQEFEIPPHAARHSVSATVPWLPPTGQLYAIIPHMHVRGKSIRISTLRGGIKQILLDVPHYDFNWQHSYYLAEPLPLSSIDKITMTATFDNSAANPNNPDPTQYVTWGDQTWQEMAIAFLEISEPRDAAKRQSRNRPAANSPDKTAAVEAFVAGFMKRFDLNRDGQVDRDEPPLSFRRFGFNRFDANGDGRLTPNEIRDAARTQL